MCFFCEYLKALKVRPLVPGDAGGAVPLSQLSLSRAGRTGADFECSQSVPQWLKNKLHWGVPEDAASIGAAWQCGSRGREVQAAAGACPGEGAARILEWLTSRQGQGWVQPCDTERVC